jgi:hypothetical protein
MTKNDVKRLRGLLTVVAGSIAAMKGDFQTRDQMNTSRMRSLIHHWQDAGREMLEILASEDLQQPGHFVMEPVSGKVLITPNGAEPGKEDDAS